MSDQSNKQIEDADILQPSNAGLSRRKFVVGAAVPTVTLFSRSALGNGVVGAACTISGFQSVNPSGVERHRASSCGGFSHGAWKNVYVGNPKNGVNGADGNMFQWASTGVVPLAPEEVLSNQNAIDTWTPHYEDAFANQAPSLMSELFTSGGGQVIHEVLLANASALDFDAVSAYLTARYFGWGVTPNEQMIHPLDVVGLYDAAPGSTYVSQSGSVVVRPSDAELANFYKQLQG